MADRDPDIRLGQFTERAEEYVGKDVFESIDDVLMAAFDALDRERAAWTRHVRTLVQEAIDDPRPPVPMDEAFARVREQIRAKYEA
ncbi:MAG: type II toxin-antitoxin system ParD family antitoxin [Pseudomonadota bacterium]